MKRLFLTNIIVLFSILYIQPIEAQEDVSLRDRIARREAQQQKSAGPELTVRAQIKNEENSRKIGNAPWVRDVYRFLDLNKEKNGALYYPVVPMGNRVNLFTMIFQRMAHGDISAYKWQLNGSDVFTEDQKVDFKTDVLDAWDIAYTEENGRYNIDDYDIPNAEVQGYYIKETWYFDSNNSVFDIKTIGICPILFRLDDYGEGTTRYPMFWVLYDDVRPYASHVPIMTSNLNNVENQTVNDFFVKHNFEGEIYKTTNMSNRKIVFSTNNEHKLEEVKSKIGKYYQIISLKDLGDDTDIPETGDTLEENALIKANYLYNKYGYNCISDDTGLEVTVLNNAPGVYSARYAGEQKSSEDNITKLLTELKGKKDRSARFRTVIALIKEGKKILFEGIVEGTITEERRGNSGFGYDSIFQPNGYNKTFAELTLDEKNTISHRARAVDQLVLFLRKK